MNELCKEMGLTRLTNTGFKKWLCPKCGWKSMSATKNQSLLHVASNCKYKPFRRHNCLTQYKRKNKKTS